MTDTDRTLEDQLEPLAADLANALADAKKATQRADEIKTEIRALLDEMRLHDLDPPLTDASTPASQQALEGVA